MRSRVEYHLPVSLFEDRYGGKEWQVVCTLNAHIIEYTMMCAILGDKDKEAFQSKSMAIYEPVSELKNKIKQANPTTLASFEASALKLYKINIHVSDTLPYKTLIDSISRRTIEFNKRDELVNPFCQLSTIPSRWLS